MRHHSKILSGLAALSIVVVATALAISGGGHDVALGAGGQNSSFVAATSSRMVVSTTTSTVILATSTSRTYAAISNDGVLPVYIALTNGAAAASSTGIRIAANDRYEIRDVNLYFGAVTAVASSSGAVSPNVLVTVTSN